MFYFQNEDYKRAIENLTNVQENLKQVIEEHFERFV